ncbi:MAG: hypothetical protein EBU93_01540 [Chlamydiae bacterium]|nr:hypothetical protein [Chlamydiota bacterium]
MKHILVIFFLLAGASSLGISNYIQHQVQQGQEQINSAEQNLDTLGKISSISPWSKSIDEKINQGANKKIDAGKSEIEKYTTISSLLKISGFVFFGIAALLFVKRFKKQ